MSHSMKFGLVVAGVLAGCSIASAQGSIAGVVRDGSGGVLPGVTVEAASPVLIEKTRAVATDGTGQYKIVDLRPGVYTVTFTLAGFNTVKREGIELTGSLTATVSVDLKVGAVEETITVTGESPIVDVQSATRERVLNKDVIDALPTARSMTALAPTVPGLSVSGGGVVSDVGGSQVAAPNAYTVHGSHAIDGLTLVNGALTTSRGDGQTNLTGPNMGAVQEVTIDIAAAGADLAQGGVRLNMIPREGANVFKGSVFGSYASHGMEGDNLTSRVQARGLATAESVKQFWDFNPGIGGPIVRDTLWFYGSIRHFGADSYAGGMFSDLNQNNPLDHTYKADLSRPATNNQKWLDGQVRLTWQASPRNKLSMSWQQQDYCRCPFTAGTQALTGSAQAATFKSPEAADYYHVQLQRVLQVEWAAPLTNRLLLEATLVNSVQNFTSDFSPEVQFGTVPLTDQSNNNLNYRANSTGGTSNRTWTYWYRGAASYVTGAHAFKAGVNDSQSNTDAATLDIGTPFLYRLTVANGVATPNQITIRDTPFHNASHVNHNLGLYAQDRWTIRRLTLGGGLRFDHLSTSDPDLVLGPTTLLPSQNTTIAGLQPDSTWSDVTFRSSATVDVFGTGKTAFRVSTNKYLERPTLGIRNPFNTFVFTTTRSWNDNFYPVGDPRRGNWTPDCDMTNPAANAECGAMANANFGKTNANPATFDPDLYSGWGHRAYNWEFSTGVQQQILPRASVDVGYYRRLYGNLRVTDNTLVAPSDYSPYSITAPVDARLPNGGGDVISGLYDLNPNKVGQVASYNTLADKYGNQIEHWNGVDVNINTRLDHGMLLQGGLSTGKTVTDNCDVVAKLDNPSPLYCHQDSGWLTQVKLVGAYTIPRAAVQISAVLQSTPGPAIAANYVVTNALIAPSLGRSLSGGAANATVNLVTPGTLYGDRLTQLDLRVGKILRLGRTRASVNLDVYNALNTDAIVVQKDDFAVWQQATRIVFARFAKFGVQFDF